MAVIERWQSLGMAMPMQETGKEDQTTAIFHACGWHGEIFAPGDKIKPLPRRIHTGRCFDRLERHTHKDVYQVLVMYIGIF